MKKLNITFCSFPDYSGNARALYEYMNKKYKDKMNLSWVIKDDELYKKLKAKSVNVVKDETEEMKNLMKKTNVFFTTHANLTEYKVQNSDSLYVELWHGVSPKCIGYLINDISDNDKTWINNITKKVDYFVVPSKFWVPIFSARFNVKPTKVLPLGFPLFDNIIKSNGKKYLNKALGIDTSEFDKVIYYMPTVRSGVSREESSRVNLKNIFNIKQYDETNITDFLKKKNYLLCIKYHPSEKLDFNTIDSKYIKYITETQLKENECDTNMILNASDMLITDYSSLGLHYLMLEKPVIYLANDMKQFNNTRGILFGDFKFWTDNEIAVDCESLLSKIEENINNYNIDKLKNKKQLLFGNLKNGGCSEICNYFFDENGQLNNNIEYTYSIEEELKEEITKLKIYNFDLNNQLSEITNSRGYKLIEKIRRIIKRIKAK